MLWPGTGAFEVIAAQDPERLGPWMSPDHINSYGVVAYMGPTPSLTHSTPPGESQARTLRTHDPIQPRRQKSEPADRDSQGRCPCQQRGGPSRCLGQPQSGAPKAGPGHRPAPHEKQYRSQTMGSRTTILSHTDISSVPEPSIL